MFAYFAVCTYEGIIEEIRAFSTIESAREYFYNGINANGKVEDCDPLFYDNGEEGDFFYWSNENVCSRVSEIRIWKVEIE